jgi:penicillin-binding protein 2
VSRARLKRRDELYTARPRAERARLLADEAENVKRDIDARWVTLAKVAKRSEADMRQQRTAIVERVTTIKNIVRARKQKEADARAAVPVAWYSRLLGGNREDVVAEVELGEERASHVIVPDVAATDYADYVELARRVDEMPGLELRPSLRRTYPFGPVAAQVLGRMGAVDSEDIRNDPGAADRLRKYADSDTRGKAGVEAMLEGTLRGRRGAATLGAGGETVEKIDMQPGRDARVTIDMALQKSIEDAFDHVLFSPSKEVPVAEMKMNGAAVVIDVATGEVRAMVSAPGYDPNTLDRDWNALATDNVNDPLLNRATLVAREPGSTVKLIVGLGAMTDRLIGPDSRIECDGYLHVNGKPLRDTARCWTMSQFDYGRHSQGASPHPTGLLNFPEAIERSCNVFFESLGDKFGIEGQRAWFERFGLGRPTGVGLPEARGRLPALDTPAAVRRSVAWFASIGQGQMAATPIQLANVAATIARDGVWARPTLVAAEGGQAPERRGLGLDPVAVRLAQEGMSNVVNAGTGTFAHLPDLEVAGKTGSAQSSPLKLIVRDPTGKPLLDARGRRIYQPVTLGTTRNINPLVPWYRAIGRGEDHLPAHAWTIGFAPRHNPKIAFAVLVEYGGSGGQSAGSVAKKLLQACQREGYLPGGAN